MWLAMLMLIPIKGLTVIVSLLIDLKKLVQFWKQLFIKRGIVLANSKLARFMINMIQVACSIAATSGDTNFLVSREEKEQENVKEVLIWRYYRRRLRANPNRAHCRALLYCRCVRTWGGVGLVVLVQ